MNARLSLAIVACWAVTLVALLATVELCGGWRPALALGAVVTALPALALILAAQRIVSTPLRRIGEAALRVTQGEAGVRVAGADGAAVGDEVSLLAGAFNAMIERLEQDMQSQREMADDLLRSERLAVAGSLAAGVAHEVNNPLAAISSLVQRVQARSEDARTREHLGEALAQIDRISAVLKELLEYARPPVRAVQAVSLNDVVERTLRLLRHDRRLRGVALEVGLDPALGTVEADPARLQQVLTNVLLNAGDAVAGRPDARVAVTTRRLRADRVELAVADNGPGVPAESRERLFEPFFTTKREGTGLGLAVCRVLVAELGGTIVLDGAEGGGTVARITLPGGAA